MNISDRKKILVCEFITAGGYAAHPLPESLAKEGALMRDALLSDLSALDQYEIIGMHDSRLAPAQLAEKSLPVSGERFKETFTQAIGNVDLIWLIAPETAGTLLELSEICYEAEQSKHGQSEHTPIFIGSGYDTMLIGTSKTLCFEALRDARINTLPVHAAEDLFKPEYYQQLTLQEPMPWVAKPEDGAGCEGVQRFPSLTALKDWLKEDEARLDYLVQPYQPGIAASMSMLCRNGKGYLLSCNRQHVMTDSEQFKLTGITVNGMTAYRRTFETIARKIAQMLPDALGYIGVDMIVNPENNRIDVLEINPRLTTSYVGLRQALNANPAQLILDCVLADQFSMPAFSNQGLAQHQVEITL